MVINGHKPSCPEFFVLVGNIITALHKRLAAKANCNLAKATQSAVRLQRASVPKSKKAFAFGCAVVPRAIANTQWNLPSFLAMSRLRTIILGGVWGCRARMRCVEILMTVMFDPTRLDPFFAAIYQSFGALRRLLRGSVDRHNNFLDNLMIAVKHQEANEDWKITGPVHGFLNACRHLGIVLDTDHRGLTITSPYGTNVDVLSADRTLFNMVVRGSVRHTILGGLQKRTATPRAKGYRKDTPGAGAYLDIRATRINFDTPSKREILWRSTTRTP